MLLVVGPDACQAATWPPFLSCRSETMPNNSLPSDFPLSAGDVLDLLELVDTNNQYNDDDETFEHWVGIINRLQSLYQRLP